MRRAFLPVFVLLALVVAPPAPGYAGTYPADPAIAPLVDGLASDITADDMRAEVGFLASDANGGRLTGSEGAWRAAQYIAAEFAKAGLRQLPGLDGWYQPFTFSSGVRADEAKTRLVLPDGTDARYGVDCLPLTFSGTGEAEGQVIFAGFGLVEPSTGDRGYDSYTGLDVTDKVVLILRDLPEGLSAERRQELALYAGDRYKAKLAADRGAKAVLLVVGPNTPGAGELIRFRDSDRTSAIPIPALSITGDLADRLLAPAAVTLKTLQDALDTGLLNPLASATHGGTVTVAAAVEHVTDTGRNVVGMLPPTGGSDEYVVVGAHYDHIGNGEGLGSLAKKGEEGQIHNGADDNASGTAMMMELAAYFAFRRAAGPGDAPQRGLIFAAWSGEELGIVGSDHFTSHPPVPIEKIAAYFNFDMVGRLRDNKLIVQAVGSSSVWRGLIEKRNIPVGLTLSPQDDPWLPTDLTAFYAKHVPGLAFFTDLHEDYNRPTDDPETLNYDGMVKVAELARRLIHDAELADTAIDYVRVEQQAAPAAGMRRRTYTGMVPDFTGGADLKGMRIADVRAGGPAEKAGLKGGDIVVEFAGKSVASLQDYSDALSGAKPGQTVPIVVLRDGKRVALEITPDVRRTD